MVKGHVEKGLREQLENLDRLSAEATGHERGFGASIGRATPRTRRGSTRTYLVPASFAALCRRGGGGRAAGPGSRVLDVACGTVRSAGGWRKPARRSPGSTLRRRCSPSRAELSEGSRSWRRAPTRCRFPTTPSTLSPVSRAAVLPRPAGGAGRDAAGAGPGGRVVIACWCDGTPERHPAGRAGAAAAHGRGGGRHGAGAVRDRPGVGARGADDRRRVWRCRGAARDHCRPVRSGARVCRADSSPPTRGRPSSRRRRLRCARQSRPTSTRRSSRCSTATRRCARCRRWSRQPLRSLA